MTSFRRRLIACAASVALVPAQAVVGASTAAADPLVTPVWLCRPGMPANPCNQDANGNPVESAGTARYPDGSLVTLDATNVVGGAPAGVERFTAQADPPVDCFYVYPTVDLLANPLLNLGSNPPVARPEEAAVMLTQAARFASGCRMFAPLYRQATLPDLAVGVLTGADPYLGEGFADVQQAWNYYWNHDNLDPATGKRRGVILLGHSQGSVALERMIQASIDGNPEVTRQLVSAVLLGGAVTVPTGGVAGGGADPGSTFQHLPLCQPGTSVPVGCVVAYSSYQQAEGTAPGSGSLAWSNDPNHQIACVNPAALVAGTDPGAVTSLNTYMPTRALVQGNILNPNGHLWLELLGYDLTSFSTGFAHYASTLTGQCRRTANASWLQIDGGANILPASASTSALGLHVADCNLALGDLAELLAAQTVAWKAIR
ncbi:DUF3089 domain-containing protein [Kribbella solani]|uniref:DUF3089 domain-containing protein n=1 Tax=Kribbella solani TaxID=236067 RepID=UPI00299FDFC5|nr:DUF3089 domain-containing protein [Kribbella solani]MDX3004491.1 DUF3089 domain-containing protein [Kribbella solani]